MTFNEIMNSPLLYALVGAGIVYILIFCVITLRKAYRHGLEIRPDKRETEDGYYLIGHLFHRPLHFHRHRSVQSCGCSGSPVVMVPFIRGGLRYV